MYQLYILEEKQAKKNVVLTYIFSTLHFFSSFFLYNLEEEKTKIGVVVKTYNFYSVPISYLRGGIGQLFIQEDKVGFLPGRIG